MGNIANVELLTVAGFEQVFKAEQLWKEVAPTVDLANCASVAMASVACRKAGSIQKLKSSTPEQGKMEGQVFTCVPT